MTVTITLPSRGNLIVADISQYATAIRTFAALIDVIDQTWRGPVPRHLTGALDQLREDLVILGGLTITTAVVDTG